MKSVYSAVRTGSLNKAVCVSSLKGIKQLTWNKLFLICWASLFRLWSDHVIRIKYWWNICV